MELPRDKILDKRDAKRIARPVTHAGDLGSELKLVRVRSVDEE
jgi:hypothetical protein